MRINFLEDTFYKFNYAEDDFDSGESWIETKEILDNSNAFDIHDFNDQPYIELFDFRSTFSNGYVSYNQSYFASKSNYPKK